MSQNSNVTILICDPSSSPSQNPVSPVPPRRRRPPPRPPPPPGTIPFRQDDRKSSCSSLSGHAKNTDWDQSRFVDTPAEQLKQLECPVCLNVLKDAVQFPCGHTFCQECANSLNNVCPVDRQSCSVPTSPNYTVRSLVGVLPICCRFKPSCHHVGTVNDIGNHESQCQYNVITCTRGCGLYVPASKVDLHNCMDALKAELDKVKSENEQLRIKNSELTAQVELSTENNSIVESSNNQFSSDLIDIIDLSEDSAEKPAIELCQSPDENVTDENCNQQ